MVENFIDKSGEIKIDCSAPSLIENPNIYKYANEVIKRATELLL